MLDPGRSLLIVDDNEDDRFLWREACRAAGIPNPLQEVRDGVEAIEYLMGAGRYADRAQFPRPALMFLDLKMPRKNGFEVLEWMRADRNMHDIPVLVMSASGLVSDVDQAYRLCANAFIVKPVSAKDLVEVAKAVRAFWLGINTYR